MMRVGVAAMFLAALVAGESRFVEQVCHEPSCGQLCSTVFESSLYKCQKGASGGSFEYTCTEGQVWYILYTSSDCSGTGVPTPESKVDQCELIGLGQYRNTKCYVEETPAPTTTTTTTTTLPPTTTTLPPATISPLMPPQCETPECSSCAACSTMQGRDYEFAMMVDKHTDRSVIEKFLADCYTLEAEVGQTSELCTYLATVNLGDLKFLTPVITTIRGLFPAVGCEKHIAQACSAVCVPCTDFTCFRCQHAALPTIPPIPTIPGCPSELVPIVGSYTQAVINAGVQSMYQWFLSPCIAGEMPDASDCGKGFLQQRALDGSCGMSYNQLRSWKEKVDPETGVKSFVAMMGVEGKPHSASVTLKCAEVLHPEAIGVIDAIGRGGDSLSYQTINVAIPCLEL